MEYYEQIWLPKYWKDLIALDGAHRRFTRILPGFENFTSGERLNRMRFFSLEQRRLIELHMIMRSVIRGHCKNLFFPDPFYTLATGIVQEFKKKTRGHMFVVRGRDFERVQGNKIYFTITMDIWKTLPGGGVDSDTITMIRRYLHRHSNRQGIKKM